MLKKKNTDINPLDQKPNSELRPPKHIQTKPPNNLKKNRSSLKRELNTFQQKDNPKRPSKKKQNVKKTRKNTHSKHSNPHQPSLTPRPKVSTQPWPWTSIACASGDPSGASVLFGKVWKTTIFLGHLKHPTSIKNPVFGT